MKKIFIILVILHFIVKNSCDMEPFVVEGQNAKETDFPYAAYLGIRFKSDDELISNSWVCGSSIVNQYVTLTAGHCVYGCKENAIITVSVGSVHIMKGTTSLAHSFLIHEKYSDIYLFHDIALVRLKTPFQFNKSVGRVALMPEPPYGEEALIAGWGLINEETNETPNVLQFTKQTVWNRNDCLHLLQKMPIGTFCARNQNKSSFVAQGDSGSALVVKDYIQLGIVSCKDPSISTSVVIYTDIGYFYNWIKQNVERIMC